MAADPESLEGVMQALTRFTEHVVRKVVIDVVANLVRAPDEGGTPVDTGWARSNWLVNIGAPHPGVIGSREAVSPHPSPITKMLGYRLGFGRVFISNNVPYIGRLNDGYSQQAPAGFVQRAIEKAIFVDLQRLRVT